MCFVLLVLRLLLLVKSNFLLFAHVICRLYIPYFKSIIQCKDIKIVDEGEVSKLSNGPGETPCI